MNNISINLHGYYNNYVFSNIFSWIDVSEFWIWFTKMWYLFLFYTH